MEKSARVVLPLLIFLLLVTNVWLIKQRLSDRKAKLTPVRQSVRVEATSVLPDYEIKLNDEKIKSLLHESGFLDNTDSSINLDTLQVYSPQKIIFSYQPLASASSSLIEAFYINNSLAYGYDVKQNPDTYTVNLYFDQAYLGQEVKQDVDYLFCSSLTKAVLYLGLINQNQRRLSATDREAISNKLSAVLNKYEDVLEVY